MAGKQNRVLVVFVDAFGPWQLEQFGGRLDSLSHRRHLSGILGYTSGALPTLLTGAAPAVHGRMCLFSKKRDSDPGILAPLGWMGLLPRLLHERQAFRRRLGKLFARLAGLTGYVALHRVPPREFAWLDLPEREDLFTAERIGQSTTFLSDARRAGLSVYSAPWQLPEEERWAQSEEVLRREAPDLAFLYAPQLDGTLHEHGNGHPKVKAVAGTIADRIDRARELMARGDGRVRTIVVGDHGMADVTRVIDPRPIHDQIRRARVFVDSTMLRVWGDEDALLEARRTIEHQRLPGTWLDRGALADRGSPTTDSPYGDAIFVLSEGGLFAPSFLGGVVRGMHGYDLASQSAQSAIVSDAPLPDRCQALSDVAGLVRSELGL